MRDYVNRDAVGFYFDEGIISVQILFIRNGKIVGGNNDKFYLISDVYDEVNSYLIHFYEKHEIPKEIILPEKLNREILGSILATKTLIQF